MIAINTSSCLVLRVLMKGPENCADHVKICLMIAFLHGTIIECKQENKRWDAAQGIESLEIIPTRDLLQVRCFGGLYQHWSQGR